MNLMCSLAEAIIKSNGLFIATFCSYYIRLLGERDKSSTTRNT